MRRLNYVRRRSAYRPRGAGYGLGAKLSAEEFEATSAAPLGECIATGRRATDPRNDDDDPLDHLLRAAALAGRG